MNVVVVESPAKAKVINKYLGPNFTVLASYGHVRDLPPKDGSVAPDKDFSMIWQVDDRAKKRLDEIAKAVKGAERLILATDPDREGEAISWHVLEVLSEKRALKGQKVERVAFNAITKQAVMEAIAHPRAIDDALVDAYRARRALDYLVGFTLSPVLWRKLPGARSAGRVQSVALRIICDRELEIERFTTQEYWTLQSVFETPRRDSFTARLVTLGGKKLEKFTLGNEAAAKRAAELVERGQFHVVAVEAKPARRFPSPPFTTSTLQQEAARKLNYSATRTMQIAQRLYEEGLITYMRTDGVQIVPEAMNAVRAAIAGNYGKNYLSPEPRIYKTKAKNAQEAHEAIRPTDFGRQPASLGLSDEQFRLFELIWKRTLASQMAAAELERTTVDIASSDASLGFRASGSVITFDGFLKLYQEGRDEPDDEDGEGRLPKVAAQDPLKRLSTATDQHFTEPPPRYSEATLVKKLEELGIGRPSTYASILQVLRDRQYVRMDKNRFIPEDKGRLVTAFLESFFRRYVEYDFTADLEEKLDEVSAGELSWKTLLADFWRDFAKTVADTGELRIGQVLDAINDLLAPHLFPAHADGSDPRRCPLCGDGRLSLKTGKFGAFVGCSNYPNCNYTRQFQASAEPAENLARTLGEDPASGLSVHLKDGRFGPYLQLGEAEKGGEKPKRAGLPKGLNAPDITLDLALKLLSLPREIGPHPDSGKPIIAGIGRFGPYLMHDGKYSSVQDPLEILDIGLDRAVTLLAEGANQPKRRGAPEVLKALGNDPDSGKPINVLRGRYGPYVALERTFASLPKGASVDEMTLDQALALIAAKAKPQKSRAAKSAKAKPAKPEPATAAATAKAPAKSKPGKAKPPAKSATKKAPPTKRAKQA